MYSSRICECSSFVICFPLIHSLNHELNQARTRRHTDKYNFDAAHERRRKEQLNRLLSRTKAEVRKQ